MRILLFLYISFGQFNIEKFKMRPRRTIQNSTFNIQNSCIVTHPGARTWCHALPWWALRCSLSSRTAAA